MDKTDEALTSEIGREMKNLRLLMSLLPKTECILPEKVNREMNELISQEFEPYFSGNAHKFQ